MRTLCRCDTGTCLHDFHASARRVRRRLHLCLSGNGHQRLELLRGGIVNGQPAGGLGVNERTIYIQLSLGSIGRLQIKHIMHI